MYAQPVPNSIKFNSTPSKRKISGETRSAVGKQARDTFLSLLKTCSKLACSATIKISFRIASPEMLPKALSLPHLECSPAVDSRGSRDEAGEHGDQE